MLNARLRIGPSGNVVVSSDMPAGAVNAAAMPFRNRAADEQAGHAGEAAEQGQDGERGERGEEDPPPAEQVGGAAAEQQQAAVAEDVSADDPLQRRRGQAKRRPDGRQRDADHGNVEGVEAQRAAEHEQHAPQPRGPAQAFCAAPAFGSGTGGNRSCGRADGSCGGRHGPFG